MANKRKYYRDVERKLQEDLCWLEVQNTLYKARNSTRSTSELGENDGECSTGTASVAGSTVRSEQSVDSSDASHSANVSNPTLWDYDEEDFNVNYSASDYFPSLNTELDYHYNFSEEEDHNNDETSDVLVREWALKFNITHTALSSLLMIIKYPKFDPKDLPLDARTPLKPEKKSCPAIPLGTGQYCHYGVKNGILSKLSDGVSSIE